jgi:hypothetical protein
MVALMVRYWEQPLALDLVDSSAVRMVLHWGMYLVIHLVSVMVIC